MDNTRLGVNLRQYIAEQPVVDSAAWRGAGRSGDRLKQRLKLPVPVRDSDEGSWRQRVDAAIAAYERLHRGELAQSESEVDALACLALE